MFNHVTSLVILLTLTLIAATLTGAVPMDWKVVPGALTILFICLAARIDNSSTENERMTGLYLLSSVTTIACVGGLVAKAIGIAAMSWMAVPCLLTVLFVALSVAVGLRPRQATWNS